MSAYRTSAPMWQSVAEAAATYLGSGWVVEAAEPAGIVLFELRKYSTHGILKFYAVTTDGIEAEEKALRADRSRYFRELVERINRTLGRDYDRIHPRPGTVCQAPGRAEP